MGYMNISSEAWQRAPATEAEPHQEKTSFDWQLISERRRFANTRISGSSTPKKETDENKSVLCL